LPSGLFLVDKEPGFTSHDVVAKARKLLGTRKVGHAGTLDPMATGLLVLGVDSATKLLTFLVGADKTYEATIRLGQATVTDDREGEIISEASEAAISKISDEDIAREISNLTGNIDQVPSSVSAIKVDGVRSYAKVRGGEEVKLAPRPVTISRFEVVGTTRRSATTIDIDVIVDCSSGTYIRALARDLGAALDVGGHLTELRRTRVGGFSVSDAQAIGTDHPKIISAFEVAKSFETLEISNDEVVDLRHGKRLKKSGQKSEAIAAVNSGKLIAMLTPSGNQLKSLVVFNEENA